MAQTVVPSRYQCFEVRDSGALRLSLDRYEHDEAPARHWCNLAVFIFTSSIEAPGRGANQCPRTRLHVCFMTFHISRSLRMNNVLTPEQVNMEITGTVRLQHHVALRLAQDRVSPPQSPIIPAS